MRGTTIPLFQKSDVDGFFGLFTNNLTNVLVLTGLLLYTVQMPGELVFGRVLPAVGLSIFVAGLLYAFMGWRLAKKEGRTDVTAMPTGISVPHMFLIVYMIMLPVKLQTGDPYLAWYAGVAWCFVEGVVETAGVLLGPAIRKMVPRAALLGSLAGASITCIMTNGALQSFEVTYIALASFAVILLGFVAKMQMPFKLPAGLVAIVLGTLLGWLSGYMDPAALSDSLANVGVYAPNLSLEALMGGFKAASPYLVTAIPLGMYNFMETLDNLESAAVAGDSYDTRQVMLADGFTSILGALFGSVVPTAVYIGHPGWKSVGARLGYSWMNGLAVLLISVFGMTSVMINIVPMAALQPILIYIGILIGSQAFEHVPKAHFPAVILALLPWLADWGITQIDNALAAAGTSAAAVGLEALSGAGIYYRGFEIIGNGNILVSMLWASLLVFMLERRLWAVVGACAVGAVFTFFGVIHAAGVGVAQELPAVAGYLLMALVSVLIFRFSARAKQTDDAAPAA